jgi:hypothetical protein
LENHLKTSEIHLFKNHQTTINSNCEDNFFSFCKNIFSSLYKRLEPRDHPRIRMSGFSLGISEMKVELSTIKSSDNICPTGSAS